MKSQDKQPVFLMIGVPGVGKSWVADQVKDVYQYVHHDGFIGHINQPEAYVKAILEAWKKAEKPLLAEAPFSISAIKDPLEKAGVKVIPVIILEDPETYKKRYTSDKNREQNVKSIPGHLTRMETYKKRAKEYKAFSGTSEEVLKYLKAQASEKKSPYRDEP